MGSPTTPTHGKHAALYLLRPGGFVGDGLNDLSWEVGVASPEGVYGVEILSEGTPDKVKVYRGGSWYDNGGAGWSITGALQGVTEFGTGMRFLFAATTGHTAGDRWYIGALFGSDTTVDGATAQITDAAMRLLDPNDLPNFVDVVDGKAVLKVDPVRGKATFVSSLAGGVGATGKYIPKEALKKIGYLRGWSMSINVDLAQVETCGDDWKAAVAGLSGGSVEADAFLIGTAAGLEVLTAAANGGQPLCLLQLYNYDPDQDQTGDHFDAWAIIEGASPSSAIGEIVTDPIKFGLVAGVAFTEDA